MLLMMSDNIARNM